MLGLTVPWSSAFLWSRLSRDGLEWSLQLLVSPDLESNVQVSPCQAHLCPGAEKAREGGEEHGNIQWARMSEDLMALVHSWGLGCGLAGDLGNGTSRGVLGLANLCPGRQKDAEDLHTCLILEWKVG